MKVLSLYDGMACGYIAFKRLGIEVEQYDAFEIDKYAVRLSKHNFPDIIYHGNVFDGDFSSFHYADWLIGGSPCTYWSISQKKNRETEASGIGWELFSQYVRALKETKPKYFLYENNYSMASAIRESISQTFGFEPIAINSALVSAQTRKRLYWVGKLNKNGMYDKVHIELPQDREIILRDILESGYVDMEKAYCLKHQSGNARDHFKKHHTNVAFEPIRIGAIENEAKNQQHDSKQYRVYSPDGKATTLCGQGGGVGAKTGLYAVPLETIRVGELPNAKGEINGSQSSRVYSIEGKSVNISSNGGGMGAKTGLYAVPIKVKEIKTNEIAADFLSELFGKKVYEVKDGYIEVNGSKYKIKLQDGFYIIRKLTVRECARLQQVPEWYDFSVISDTQSYKCLGNGWSIEVIMHLIRSALKNDTEKPNKIQLTEQLRLEL